jgi:hypothetical protein
MKLPREKDDTSGIDFPTCGDDTPGINIDQGDRPWTNPS